MDHNPIIVALDVPSAAEARALIDKLGAAIDFYKIGMELYAAEGMSFVRELISSGRQVFLDLKLYDIGETVKRAVTAISKTGVQLLTVHGSDAIMRAAVEGRGGNLKLLGVTVLTSFDQQDLHDLGYPVPVADLVALRARKAAACGVDGVVCSPLDTAAVRQITGRGAIIVNPGVRSRTADTGDQKRVATPAEALAAGADYIVMGREVIRAADPAAQFVRILDDVRAAAR